MFIPRFRRLFSLVATVMVLMATLAACGGVKDTTIPAPPSSSKVEGAGEGVVGTIMTAIDQSSQAELAKDNATKDASATYTTTASFDEVVSFYQQQMKERGWKVATDGEQIDKATGTAGLDFVSGKNHALILAFDMAKMGDKGVMVMTINAHEN
jgi:uncharacterized lipoprotein YajG